MTAGGILLLMLWMGSHLLVLNTVRVTRQPHITFVMISMMLMLAYLMKPYTYDLNKYSIFFHTGFIAVQAWHSPNDEFRLDPLDTTGKPFDQAFEVGFKWLAKIGSKVLPAGSLVPRLDADFGDFRERGPPRSDAMIFLIMGLGFMVLFAGIRSFGIRNYSDTHFTGIDLVPVAAIILGSLFFILGSQNSLRQFLGLTIVFLAMASMASRHYFVSAILVVLSGVFHKWSPILGMIGIYLVILGSVSKTNHATGEVHPFRLSYPETFALISGIMLVILIKSIMVTGMFNLDIPLFDDLKPYVIKANEFNIVNSLERISVLLKGCFIFGLVLISEGLIGKSKHNESANNDIRSLRRRTIVFIFPLIIYPEIFSRVMVLYWAVEIIFLVWALNSDETRVRLGGAVVFVAYGFAPNAVSILIGPNWLYSF